MNLSEACGILFPIIINSSQKPVLDKETKAWLEATVTLLDKCYPEDIFTGISGDKGAVAIKVVRENLEVEK